MDGCWASHRWRSSWHRFYLEDHTRSASCSFSLFFHWVIRTQQFLPSHHARLCSVVPCIQWDRIVCIPHIYRVVIKSNSAAMLCFIPSPGEEQPVPKRSQQNPMLVLCLLSGSQQRRVHCVIDGCSSSSIYIDKKLRRAIPRRVFLALLPHWGTFVQSNATLSSSPVSFWW